MHKELSRVKKSNPVKSYGERSDETLQTLSAPEASKHFGISKAITERISANITAAEISAHLSAIVSGKEMRVPAYDN